MKEYAVSEGTTPVAEQEPANSEAKDVPAAPDQTLAAERTETPDHVDALDGGEAVEGAEAVAQSDEESQSQESAVVEAPESGDSGVESLEHEGDIAADYLEELLDIADLDGDIDLDVEGSRAMVAVVGEGLESLVGAEGEVLDALQELTRLAVYSETGERSRLMLDVAGHRAARRAELVELAGSVIDDVKQSGERVRLNPMTPFERKIVHDTVAAAGLHSESEGEEPERRVVVRPA